MRIMILTRGQRRAYWEQYPVSLLLPWLLATQDMLSCLGQFAGQKLGDLQEDAKAIEAILQDRRQEEIQERILSWQRGEQHLLPAKYLEQKLTMVKEIEDEVRRDIACNRDIVLYWHLENDIFAAQTFLAERQTLTATV